MARNDEQLKGTTEANEKSEHVKQHQRMAAGAWIDGEEFKEESRATMPQANSDHGNFHSGVHKDNA
jgi:hypothetical protein